jgi:hypothetical protein
MLGSIIGAVISSNANKKAASAQAAASERAAQIQADALRESTRLQIEAGDRAQAEFRAAGNRGIDAIRAGTLRFASTMQPLTERQPEFYNPNFRLGLTENQTLAREDLQRTGRATIAKSGLRGAGRAGAAAILNADQRFMAKAAEDNDQLNRNAETTNINLRENARNKRDAATSDIARMFGQEGGTIANTELGQGNNIANSISNVGNATAGDTRAIGQVQANSITNQADARTRASLDNARLWSDLGGEFDATAQTSALAMMGVPSSPWGGGSSARGRGGQQPRVVVY